MANQDANTINIPIAASINLNSNKAAINSDFNGFNENNSPVIGGCLQPFYLSKKTESQIIYDEDGNAYSIDDEGNIYKNKTLINTVNNEKIVKTKLSNDAIDNDYPFAIDDDGKLAYMDNDGNCIYDGVVIAKHNNGTITDSIVWYDRNPYLNDEYWCSNRDSSGKIRYDSTSALWCPDRAIFFVSTTSSGSYYNTITITYFNLSTMEATTTTDNILEIKESVSNKLVNIGYVDTPNMRLIIVDGGVPIAAYRIKQHKIYHTVKNDYSPSSYFPSSKLVQPINIVVGAMYWNSIYPQIGTNKYIYKARYSNDTRFGVYWDRSVNTIFWYGYIYENATDDLIYIDIKQGFDSGSSTTPYYVVESSGDGFGFSYLGRIDYTNKAYFHFIADQDRTLYGFDSTGMYCPFLSTGLSGIGYVVNLSDNIRLLYNNNELSGISWFTGKKNIGTLVCPWFHVDKIISVLNSGIVYKDTNGDYYQIGTEEGASISLVADRYLIVNTTSIKNCYDIETGKWHQYASDWNNRAYYPTFNNWSSMTYNTYYNGSGISVHYELSGDYTPSAEFAIASSSYNNSGTTSNARMPCAENSPDPIEFYTNGGSGTTFSYKQSYLGDNTWETDSTLSGQVYPVQSDGSTYINPSLFATFVESFFNRDFVKDGGSIYSLVYYNSTIPVMLVKDTTEIENVDSFFVINGYYYALANRFIYNATYDTSDGSINTVDPIVKTDNMRFIGNTPATAFFYSDINKTIYLFQGDRTLSPLTSANGIETINTYCWDSTTQTLFFICKNYVYALTSTPDGTGWYKLNIEDATSFKSTDEGVIEVITANGSYELSTDYIEDGEPIPIELQTQYYGIGNDKIGIVDCFYIKFYNQGTAYSGDVVLGVNTLTDKGTESCKEKIHINKDDWDKITGTYLYRYQPQYQRGLGTSLYIKSDFPICEIVASVSEDTAKQLTKKVDHRTNGGFY